MQYRRVGVDLSLNFKFFFKTLETSQTIRVQDENIPSDVLPCAIEYSADHPWLLTFFFTLHSFTQAAAEGCVQSTTSFSTPSADAPSKSRTLVHAKRYSPREVAEKGLYLPA
jgi:hypothetical protein